MIPYSLPEWLDRLPQINSRSKIIVLSYQFEAAFLAIEAIHQYPGNKHTHASLARIAGINERTLRYVFKMITGQTISRYIRRLRLDEARKAIQAGASIDSAALVFGYNDVRHFQSLLKQ